MASGSPFEAVADHDAHIAGAAVLDLGQHRQPELRKSAHVPANLCKAVPEVSRVGQAGGVDAVGEVGDDRFVAHAVGGGDEHGIDGADEVDQSGGAQDPRLDADRTQEYRWRSLAMGRVGRAGAEVLCIARIAARRAGNRAIILHRRGCTYEDPRDAVCRLVAPCR